MSHYPVNRATLTASTTAAFIVNTPVTVHGWTVFNNAGSTQGAQVSNATNGISTTGVGYAAGTTDVNAHGWEVPAVAVKMDHTNMSVTVFYSPGQV